MHIDSTTEWRARQACVSQRRRRGKLQQSSASQAGRLKPVVSDSKKVPLSLGRGHPAPLPGTTRLDILSQFVGLAHSYHLARASPRLLCDSPQHAGELLFSLLAMQGFDTGDSAVSNHALAHVEV